MKSVSARNSEEGCGMPQSMTSVCNRGGERGTGGERKGKGKGREGVRRAPISCWHRAPRRVNPALDFCLFVTFVKDNMCVSYYTMR